MRGGEPFALPDEFDYEYPSDIREQSEAALDSLFDLVMTEDTPEIFDSLEMLIKDFELKRPDGYYEGRGIDFWHEADHENYLCLRRRRAILHFQNNRNDAAIAELQDLLKLDTNDTIDNHSM